MDRINLTPTYILHAYKYKETSLLLDVFSKEFGRIALLAKGSRKNKKYRSIGFNLYQQYLISWLSRSELGILTEIELIGPVTVLKEYKVLSGFYLNEIIMRLLHKHAPHPELFEYYTITLKKLMNNEPEKIVLRYFEKNLLQSIGYGLLLDRDVQTGEIISDNSDYYYQFEQGPSIHSYHSTDTFRISGETLICLKNETLKNIKHINEARSLLKKILAKHLGSKPLASRALYNAYLKNRNVA